METVIGKWSKDISEMESKIAEMIKAFDVYANQFHVRVNTLKDAFEAFANQSRAEANAMSTHIWGKQEAKEAWQKKYGR